MNSAFELRDAGRWQPGLSEATEAGWGIYKLQQFRTPQFAFVEPYALANLNGIEFDVPEASNPENADLYKEQADAVLQVRCFALLCAFMPVFLSAVPLSVLGVFSFFVSDLRACLQLFVPAASRSSPRCCHEC